MLQWCIIHLLENRMSRNGTNIRAIFFDLDSCLSAPDEFGHELLEPVIAAIGENNKSHYDEKELAEIFSEIWMNPFDFVVEKHRFPPLMRGEAWKAYSHLEVTTPMFGYSDLSELSRLPVMRFLITSGFRRLQESKVRSLGIARCFEEVYIDAIDENPRKGKQGIFEEILQQRHWQPSEVLVVGDNPHSEIKAGNNLGIPTVQILRPGVIKGDNATYYVRGLAELHELL